MNRVKEKIQDLLLKLYTVKYKLTKKLVRNIIHVLQPGAEDFYCFNDKLLMIKNKNYYCNYCLIKAVRSDQYDRYACLNCNQWLEDSCGDKNCWQKSCNQEIPLPNQCQEFVK